jgi:hypothetical protein
MSAVEADTADIVRPNDIVYREKNGFAAPFDKWLGVDSYSGYDLKEKMYKTWKSEYAEYMS